MLRERRSIRLVKGKARRGSTLLCLAWAALFSLAPGAAPAEERRDPRKPEGVMGSPGRSPCCGDAPTSAPASPRYAPASPSMSPPPPPPPREGVEEREEERERLRRARERGEREAERMRREIERQQESGEGQMRRMEKKDAETIEKPLGTTGSPGRAPEGKTSP